MKQRGYTYEQCDAAFQKRQADYEHFILPQMDYADICIEYSTTVLLPEIVTLDLAQPPVQLILTCTSPITDQVRSFLYTFCKEEPRTHFDKTSFKICNETHLVKSLLLQYLPVPHKHILQLDKVQCGYLGLLQCIFLLLCFKP
jgi:hypothetical protein